MCADEMWLRHILDVFCEIHHLLFARIKMSGIVFFHSRRSMINISVSEHFAKNLKEHF